MCKRCKLLAQEFAGEKMHANRQRQAEFSQLGVRGEREFGWAGLRRLVLAFTLFLELAFFLSRGVLVLLVLRNKVIHVRLCLRKLHLVHALAGIPVEETLSSEHGRELFRDALKQLLDGCAVADERGRHLETSRWNVADGRLHVVRDPLDKVRAVLVLDVQHLLIDLQHKATSLK